MAENDHAYLGAGAGLASMAVHATILTALMGRGIMRPAEVREILDTILLAYETEERRGDDPERRRVMQYARQQTEDLVALLEVTSPQMKQNPPSS